MGKRYHSTELIKKKWWIDLSKDHKLLLDWIYKTCSISGIWEIELRTANAACEFEKGRHLDIDEFIEAVNSGGKTRIVKIDNGSKLWIPKTMEFQVGKNTGIVLLDKKVPAKGAYAEDLRRFPETNDWLEDQLEKGLVMIGYDLKDKVEGAGRKRITEAFKTKIKERDDYTCVYCGNGNSEDTLTVDHVTSQSKGGSNSWFNVVTACFNCNHEKGDSNVIDYINKKNIKPKGSLKEAVDLIVKQQNNTSKNSEDKSVAKAKVIPFNSQDKDVTMASKDSYVRQDKNDKIDHIKNFESSSLCQLEEDTVKEVETATDKAIFSSSKKVNNPPTPHREKPADLKEWLNLYGQDSNHKHIIPLWLSFDSNEKDKIFRGTKKLKADGKLKGKDPYYFLNDKNYDLPPDDSNVYKVPKLDLDKYPEVDYEARKERNAKEAEQKRIEREAKQKHTKDG